MTAPGCCSPAPSTDWAMLKLTVRRLRQTQLSLPGDLTGPKRGPDPQARRDFTKMVPPFQSNGTTVYRKRYLHLVTTVVPFE